MMQEEHRVNEFSNVQQRTSLSLKELVPMVGVIGALFAAWINLSTQMTEMKVTQSLKFEHQEKINNELTSSVKELSIKFESIDDTVSSIYSEIQKKTR